MSFLRNISFKDVEQASTALWRQLVQQVSTWLPRDKIETFAKDRPVLTTLIVLVTLLGALPVGTFLAFVVFAACVAFAIFFVVIGLAFVLLLLVMTIVVAAACALTVPVAAMWMAWQLLGGSGNPLLVHISPKSAKSD